MSNPGRLEIGLMISVCGSSMVRAFLKLIEESFTIKEEILAFLKDLLKFRALCLSKLSVEVDYAILISLSV